MLVVKMTLISDVDLIVILVSYAYSKSGLSDASLSESQVMNDENSA